VSAWPDVAFLAVIVLVSCTPYVGGLGLYSDDWAFLSTLHDAGGSFPRLFGAILPMEMSTRPVQAVLLAALYAVFGNDPLGWHVTNAFVLTATVVLFHLSLRAIGFARLPALLIPLVFGLLPHYSTDRVWIAAFQANAALLLYFASLGADLQFLRRADARRWLWKGLGSAALVASALAYEVTAPLLLLNVVVLGGLGSFERARRATPRLGPTLAGIVSNVVLLAATIGYKLSTTIRADISGGYIHRVLRIVREAVPVHFGDYGVELPARVVQILSGGPAPWVVAVAALIGLATGIWLLVRDREGAETAIRRVDWRAITGLGAILFVAGYGVTLMTWEIGFHATGANNRTAIVAAIGVAFVFVGVLGWIARSLPSARTGRRAIAVLAGMLAAVVALITGSVADHWADAAREQEAVIAAIHERFPDVPAGTTLLLDGLCPYVGPAPVFATGWDVTGMLQLTYDKRDVRGDVIKPNSEATPEGLRTTLFDDVINVYPYGSDLYAYHVASNDVYPLPDEETARRYLEGFSTMARPACPRYSDGDGIAIF
jgi:hypothetical protein